MKGRIVITVPDQGPAQMQSQFDVPTTALLLAQMWVSVVNQSIPPLAPPVAVPTPEQTAELQQQQRVLVG